MVSIQRFKILEVWLIVSIIGLKNLIFTNIIQWLKIFSSSDIDIVDVLHGLSIIDIDIFQEYRNIRYEFLIWRVQLFGRDHFHTLNTASAQYYMWYTIKLHCGFSEMQQTKGYL
jgi:hypothetical protein